MNSSLRTQFLLALFLCLSAFRTDTVSAQFRVVPERSKGGANYAPYAEPWTDIPDAFRDFKIPAWPVPTDLSKWKTTGRNEVRQVLLHCLGEMPTRPDPKQVRIISREEKEFFVLERFEFFNGVDMTVPGILVLPKHSTGKVPVVLGLHGHSGSKHDYLPDPTNPLSLGWMLVQNGYAVAAIDGYFNGDRVGKGPRGPRDAAAAQELSLFKLHLWQGCTLWGMMLRDEQSLLDYLATRNDLDMNRVGATGMSMDRLYDKPEAFRSVLYQNTGHEYLPEMRREMIEWF